MRRLLFIVIAAMGMFKGHSQALVQTYTDRCTGQVHVFSVPMNGQSVVVFYNKSRTFTAAQFTNGELKAWLEETYNWYQALSPCSTGSANTNTTQQTTSNATSNATNAASNATNNTGTTNTNTNGNTGSTNTGSTGSSSSGSGSTSGSSSSGSTGGDSGGTSSGSSDSSGGDTGGNTNNDSSGQDSSGSDNSDSNSNSSDTDNSSGNGDSSDDSSSGGSGDDQSSETEEGSSNESSDESSNEENKESDSSESEESENKESEESESEEEVEEESNEEESEEETEEESSEESNEEDEEEEEEKSLAPPIVTANIVTMQMIDGVLTNAASFGYSQSSLAGDVTYSANAMVWSNLKQFSINISQSSVLFNWDRKEDIMVLDPDTMKMYKFGEVAAPGTVMKVQTLSLGYMKMFTTDIVTAGISDVFLGQKDNFWKGFVGGWALTGMGVFLDGGNIVATAALTAFGTKPFTFKNYDRLTVSPMLAYSMSPVTYDKDTHSFILSKDGTWVLGSNFDFNLTQRFKANIGGTLIGSTIPEMPLSWALTVGSRFQF